MPLMRFVLEDGTEVEIEAEAGIPATEQGHTMRGGESGPVERAGRSFEQALGAVKRTVWAAVRELRDAFPDRPDELQVEFGIKASIEANALIVAKTAGEASFTVKALWKKPEPPRPV
jgi:hypothetical protein